MCVRVCVCVCVCVCVACVRACYAFHTASKLCLYIYVMFIYIVKNVISSVMIAPLKHCFPNEDLKGKKEKK